jgi:hypothetical protein
MKKCVFVSVLAALLAFSCGDVNMKNITITNSSGFPVTFKFSASETTHSLGARETAVFEKAIYDEIGSYGSEPGKRVYLASEYSVTAEFKEYKSYPLKVNNTIDKPVTLSADDWMEDMDIPAGQTVSNDYPDDASHHERRVYTDKPNFTAIAIVDGNEFPAKTSYIFTVDGAQIKWCEVIISW